MELGGLVLVHVGSGRGVFLSLWVGVLFFIIMARRGGWFCLFLSFFSWCGLGGWEFWNCFSPLFRGSEYDETLLME